MPPLWQESERKVKLTPAGIWLTSSRTSSSVVNPANIPQHTPTTQDLICEHWNAQEKSVGTKVRKDKPNRQQICCCEGSESPLRNKPKFMSTKEWLIQKMKRNDLPVRRFMSVGTMASSVSDSPGAPLSGGSCCIAFTLLFKRSVSSSHFHDGRCAPKRSVVCLVRERRFKD